MNLRLRGPYGQATLTGLDPEMDVATFKDLLVAHTGVVVEDQEIMSGYPPKTVEISKSALRKPLELLGLTDGELVTVRVREGGAAPSMAHHGRSLSATRSLSRHSMRSSKSFSKNLSPSMQSLNEEAALSDQLMSTPLDEEDPMFNEGSAFSPRPPNRPIGRSISQGDVLAADAALAASADNPHSAGPPDLSAPSARMDDHLVIARRAMDDDNSCLFSAVAYVMDGFRSKGPELRRVIAEAVTTNSASYNEAFLGKPPAEYARWITDPSKWGGAIELSILSKYYEREIAAYDIKTLRCDVYGEGSGYRERGMVIYDGLHYDALSIAAFENAPEDVDVSVFDPNGPQGEPAHRGALEIARQAQKDKQFTDTATFTLRCQICKAGVTGEAEALDHAKATGHAAFAEFNSQDDPGSPHARLRSSTSFNSRVRVGAGM